MCCRLVVERPAVPNPESLIVQQCQLAATASGTARLFRNQVGACRTIDGRFIKYGIANPGGSDLIGWHTVLITPQHVGRNLAVFVACEVKTATGKVSTTQQAFIDAVREAGGIGLVARSPQELEQVLRA